MYSNTRHFHFPFSPVRFCVGTAGVLFITYLALIAVVMSYATLTVEFSQSVKDDESVVAALESEYLSSVARITGTDYAAAGYALPIAQVFVPAKSVTALR